MTKEERKVSDNELSFLICAGVKVSVSFSPSGSILKEDNPLEVFVALGTYRDEQELEKHHRSFKL